MYSRIGRAAGALAVVMVAGAALFAQDAKDAKASADLKKLQGQWTTPSQGGGDVVYTFKDDKVTVKAPTREYKMTVKLDDAAKPNKTIDLHIDEGPDDAKDATSKGIYKFDGNDKFVFCFMPEGERPTKFEQVGMEQFLVELKRKEVKK
jgi:uncharacterized protein (TIGR03067 family)